MLRSASIIFFIISCLFFSCKPDKAIPELDRILNDAKGEVGEPIFIEGSLLDNVIELYFNDFAAEISTRKFDSLGFTVPDVPPGLYQVYATSIDGESNTLPFNVHIVPKIDSIDPNLAMVGDSVDILGQKFGTENAKVLFSNDISIEIPQHSDSLIQVMIPEGVINGRVFVEREGVRSQTGVFLEIISDPESPVITSIEPDQALRNDRIRIVGRNLAGGSVFVIFPGEKLVEVPNPTATELNVLVPLDAPFGSGEIRVEVDGQESNRKPFSVIKPLNLPELDRIVPDSAEVGEVVRIEGKNLSGNAIAVLFSSGTSAFALGEVQGQPDANNIYVKVPNAAVDGDVYVEVDGLRSDYVFFDVIAKDRPQPMITSLSSDSLGYNDTLIINGTNFKGSIIRVFFRKNGITENGITFPSTDTSRIITRTPGYQSLFEGQVEVFVVVDGIHSDTASFELVPPPLITSASPQPVFTGDNLRLDGDNFVPGKTTVTFLLESGSYASVPPSSINKTRLEVTVPVNAVPGDQRTIRVNNTFGNRASYNIKIELPLSISQILPSNNRPNGPLVIWGKNMDRVKSIQFGNNPPNFNFNYSAGCKCIGTYIPAQIPPGKVDIRLFTQSGGSSPKYPYTVGQGSPLPPSYTGSPVVLPPPNVGSGIGLVQNEWTIGDPISGQEVWGGRLILDDINLTSDSSAIFDEGTQSIIGYVYTNKDSISIDLGGARYFGRSSPRLNPSGDDVIILTPYVSGNQLEMVQPVALDSVSPRIISRGDTFSVFGRYFIQNEFSSGSGINITLDSPNFPIDNNDIIYVSGKEFKIVTDQTFPTGNIDIEFSDGIFPSEPIYITINP